MAVLNLLCISADRSCVCLQSASLKAYITMDGHPRVVSVGGVSNTQMVADANKTNHTCVLTNDGSPGSLDRSGIMLYDVALFIDTYKEAMSAGAISTILNGQS